MGTSFSALAELLRPLNCLIAAFAVFVGYAVSVRALQFNWQLLPAMLAAFFVCGAGQAINDYFDARIDKKKNPKKPIPSGRIKAANALVFSFALFSLGNILAFLVNETAFAIAVAFTLLLVLYSAFLGKAKFIGNWVVAAGTAFTLIFGATISGNYSAIFFLAASAMLANAVREIIKDKEDIYFDRGFKNSLPMLLERGQLLVLVSALSVAAFVLAFAPVALGIFGNVRFVFLVFTANILFFGSVILFWQKKYSLAQQLSKAGMLLALVGFLAGVA